MQNLSESHAHFKNGSPEVETSENPPAAAVLVAEPAVREMTRTLVQLPPASTG